MAKRGCAAELFVCGDGEAARRVAEQAVRRRKRASVWLASLLAMLRAWRRMFRDICEKRGIGIFLGEIWIASLRAAPL